MRWTQAPGLVSFFFFFFQGSFLIHMLYLLSNISPSLTFPMIQVLFVSEKSVMGLKETTIRNCSVSLQEPDDGYPDHSSFLTPPLSTSPGTCISSAHLFSPYRNHSLDIPGQGQSFLKIHCSNAYDPYAANNLHRHLGLWLSWMF